MNYRHFVTGCLCLLSMHVSAQSIIENKSEEELSLMLDEVVVTGTGTEHFLKDAPVQTEVINRKMLESYGGSSLEEILSSLSASFDFNQSDMGSQMQVGGLGNDYILVLIDGKKIHGDVGGQNNLGLIDPARIDKIEIVKGASSTLYGSDAMAAVINIITKKNTTDDIFLSNTTRGGSYGELRQSNTVQFKLGKVTSITNFQLKHSDGWQNTTVEDPRKYEKPVTNSINKTANRYTDWQVEERLEYQPTKNLSLYAEGMYYRKRIYRPRGIPDYKTYDLAYKNTSLAGGGRLNLKNHNYITLDINYDTHNYYYDYTFETWEFNPDNPNRPLIWEAGDRSLQSDQERVLSTAKGVFNLPGMNRLSVGGEFQYDWLKAPKRLDTGDTASDYTGALYVQDEWSGLNNLNVTAGVRLTLNKEFGAKVSPKISAMYKLGDFNLRATYSEGFKTPTLKELHYLYVRQMSIVILNMGNLNLNPQTNRYVSAGLEYNTKRFNVSVTGYMNWLDNMITLVTIPTREAPGDIIIAYDPNRVRQYKNMDDARTTGVDLNIKWMPISSLTLTGGYSYLDTDANLASEDSHGKAITLKDVVIDGMAHHRGTFSAAWNKGFNHNKYRLSVGLFGRFQSKRYYQDDGNGKAYQIWRLNTRHQFNLTKQIKADINAGVDNILNYYETTPHGLNYGTTTPGRTVYASLTLQFGKQLRANRSRSNNTEE